MKSVRWLAVVPFLTGVLCCPLAGCSGKNEVEVMESGEMSSEESIAYGKKIVEREAERERVRRASENR